MFDDNIVIYGLDADLIFLAMASNRENIYLLREQSLFKQKEKNKQEIKEEIKEEIKKHVKQLSIYQDITNKKNEKFFTKLTSPDFYEQIIKYKNKLLEIVFFI